ncbi:sensor histidine kinase [Gordonia zhaorongruii]|uniref:sensor histidine kinase n=1 Tax=Gordonia zhaorongruii TaxID=2597659 RepID=UPI00104C46A9|nr:histidine kinase [Gordonia zhaorongruii]
MRDPLRVGALSRRSIVFDVVSSLVAGGAVTLVNSGLTAPVHVADALICLALVSRRLAPSLMIVSALASATVQVAATDVTAFSMAYAVLFYMVGRHPARRVRTGSLFVAITGSVVAGITMPYTYPNAMEGGGSHIWAMVFATIGTAVVVVGGWVVGYIGFQRRSVAAAEVSETIAELERRRVLDLYDEQSERSRLARDMHDVVAHSLAVVVAQAEGARYAIDQKPEAARDALGVIADTARSALADVRGVLEDLRSTDTPGEVGRTDRDQLYGRMRAAGMRIDSTETGETTADAGLRRVAFAVLTESLTNALKYGDLRSTVIVHHDWTDGCRLTVRNVTSDDPLAPGGARHGIIGMAERAAHAGGILCSERDGAEWLVILDIPSASAMEGPPR